MVSGDPALDVFNALRAENTLEIAGSPRRTGVSCASSIKEAAQGYEVYKDELDRVCEELLRYDEIRHFMTHGFLSLTIDRKSNHQFEFLRYQRDGEGKFTLLSGKPRLNG